MLKEAYRVLQFGGELYFSDVYADRELSDEIRQHKVLWGKYYITMYLDKPSEKDIRY